MRILMVAAVAVLPAMASAQSVTPGQWEIAVTTKSVVMPSMPAAAVQAMVGKTTRVQRCLTPADAKLGPQDLLKSAKSCAITKYSLVGGRLHAEMSCKQSGGTTQSISDGTFTPTSYNVTGKVMMTGAAAMTMTVQTVGKRVGACR